jgi:DNA-binding NarL/FixJ family response regulator
MDAPALIEALSRPEAYPGRSACVEPRTTMDRVYKVKCAVDYGFLDFSTLEKRRHCREEEVRLNRRLAPWVYRGVVPVRRDPEGVLHVDGPGETVECAVEMERLPEEGMLDRMLAADDCVEFSQPLRCVDVASDLTFRYMDLDRRGFHVSAPAQVVRERLERRVLEPEEVSQADFAVYQAERASFEALDEIDPVWRLSFASGEDDPALLATRLLLRRIICGREGTRPANKGVKGAQALGASLGNMQEASVQTAGPTSMEPKIRVYLVDDQAMIRAAVKSFLGQRERFEVVGSCGDARKALEEIQTVRPDVIILDITMPGLSGLDAIPLIRKAVPKARIVMLTHHEGETVVEQALKAGAEGYLSKDSEPAELALAIEAVHRGDPFVSPKVAAGLVTGFRAGRDGEVAPRSRLGVLTPREREVFQLLALGKSNKEVAVTLEMSLGTAKKHRENLQRKLHCNSAAELARLAIREGLLQA